MWRCNHQVIQTANANTKQDPKWIPSLLPALVAFEALKHLYLQCNWWTNHCSKFALDECRLPGHGATKQMPQWDLLAKTTEIINFYCASYWLWKALFNLSFQNCSGQGVTRKNPGDTCFKVRNFYHNYPPSFMCYPDISPTISWIGPSRSSMIPRSQQTFRPVPGVWTHKDAEIEDVLVRNSWAGKPCW